MWAARSAMIVIRRSRRKGVRSPRTRQHTVIRAGSSSPRATSRGPRRRDASSWRRTRAASWSNASARRAHHVLQMRACLVLRRMLLLNNRCLAVHADSVLNTSKLNFPNELSHIHVRTCANQQQAFLVHEATWNHMKRITLPLKPNRMSRINRTRSYTHVKRLFQRKIRNNLALTLVAPKTSGNNRTRHSFSPQKGFIQDYLRLFEPFM